MKRLAAAAGVLVFAILSAAAAEDASTPARVIIAYARESELEMLVGQYDPGTKKWLDPSNPFTPPAFRARFTLFGCAGKFAEVRLNEDFKTRPEEPPWSWDVEISGWSRTEVSEALALAGSWTDSPRHGEPVPLDDPAVISAVSKFLRDHRVPVEAPLVTQALRVDVDGDGAEEILVSANSDNSGLTTEAPAAVYALVLMVTQKAGKSVVLPVRTTLFTKPAHRPVEEFERLYGRLRSYQTLAFTDIDRDGRLEVAVLNGDRHEGPEVDLYTFRGGKVIALLKAKTVYF